MSKKTVLHEIIAVESSKQKLSETIVHEGTVTFAKKGELFRGHSKEYKPFDESEKILDPEVTVVSETVEDKIKYVFKSLSDYLNLVYQKDATNQLAKADLIVDGVVIAEQLPATFLLSMESKFRGVRDFLLAAPTLAPNIEWVPAPDQGNGIMVAKNDDQVFRTKKVMTPIVLSEATEHHPAQVKEGMEVVNVGIANTKKFSSAITPLRKSELLERCDKLILAFKTARQRANGQEIVKTNVAKKLFNYILS